MLEYFAGFVTAGMVGAIAYGDLRGKIGKLEGKMELISRDIKVIMKNNGIK